MNKKQAAPSSRTITKEALESNWPDEDKGIYIAAITVTPTHRAVITREWEEDGDEGREYRIEKIQL